MTSDPAPQPFSATCYACNTESTFFMSDKDPRCYKCKKPVLEALMLIHRHEGEMRRLKRKAQKANSDLKKFLERQKKELT